MRFFFVCLLSTLVNLALMAQENKVMDESVYTKWNSISGTKITNNGDWVMYTLKPGYGDQTLVIYNTRNKKEFKFSRSEKAMFDETGSYLYFLRKPAKAFVKDQKRMKVKEKDMPSDTLVIYDLRTQFETSFPNISNYQIPKNAGPTIAAKIKSNKKPNKNDDKIQNTFDVIVFNPTIRKIDTLRNVIQFVFAEDNPSLLYSVKSDSLTSGGVFMHNGASIDTIFAASGKIYQLSIGKLANQAAFVIDTDTSDILKRPYQLFYWEKEEDNVLQLLHTESEFLPENWKVSNEKKPTFSDDGKRLFFGIAPYIPMQDTSKIDEEIINVEVWHYQQAKLYTQQENDVKDDEIKSYDAVYFTDTGQFKKLQEARFPYLRMDHKRQGDYALLYTDLPYKLHETWQGYAERDVYKVKIETGEVTQVAHAVHGSPRISPEGKYLYWYSSIDSSWVSHNLSQNTSATIANSKLSEFSNELHDAPSYPRSYGIAGWSKNDEHIIIYDRYDLWLIDPNMTTKPKNLTNGRPQKKKYSYINLDSEEKNIDLDKNILLYVFDEKDKSSGYVYYNHSLGEINDIIHDHFQFTRNVIKAKDSDDVLFTKQSFQRFPDLIHSDLSFTKTNQISNANPWQKEYSWGNNQIISWTAFDGQKLDGILATPPNFDPKKKYPLLVNFYERSSNGLHRHRAPSAGRSTINYSFYTNRGYVIFNPDVPYTIGEPGESCYNAVISGVAALIAKGFIDKDRIGVQGHSWGGYQVAHLVTKTDVFRCAEAGAPLVNMISAYGGIRWGTGRSRQFQYEKTQSRLGGSLWETPELYIKNSPLFNADQINTPVLIMHNDADGHVPWHLGIEFFMALRRLQKPSWFLNYNGEPHWPLKWQNRLDFNIRMQQYFDHYLMDAPMPEWMKNGIPAMEKGISSGYGLDDKK